MSLLGCGGGWFEYLPYRAREGFHWAQAWITAHVAHRDVGLELSRLLGFDLFGLNAASNVVLLAMWVIRGRFQRPGGAHQLDVWQ